MREKEAPRRAGVQLKTRPASREVVRKFIMKCCGLKSLDENQPITSLEPDVPCGNKPYYTVVAWAEGKFNKRVENAFVESKTIGELIDFLTSK